MVPSADPIQNLQLSDQQEQNQKRILSHVALPTAYEIRILRAWRWNEKLQSGISFGGQSDGAGFLAPTDINLRLKPCRVAQSYRESVPLFLDVVTALHRSNR